MKITSFEDLVYEVNNELGDFCTVFAGERKKLARMDRSPRKDVLFKYDSGHEGWAINEGGHTEIQFHIYMRDDEVGYGLGFNMQPSRSNTDPVSKIKPFCDAFVELYDKGEIPSGFDWIENDDSLIRKPKYGGYALYGKTIKLVNGELPDTAFKQIIADVKEPLFKLYKRVFTIKNNKQDSIKKSKDMIDKYTTILKEKLNIILQGAPGTGKTYNTAAIALATLDVTGVDLSDHEKVMERYRELQDKQIFFTTFHQSLDYEDFVEGLKPQVIEDASGDSVGVTYKPEDGIFKRACNAARGEYVEDIIVRIDQYLQTIKGEENKKEIPTITGRSSIYVWWDEGNETIIAKSTSSESQTGNVPRMNIDKIKLQAIGKGKENNREKYAEAFINAVNKAYGNQEKKPVVLIIDEINRGNVSKIFGELITLLEADKREGATHPISVTLPYSKKPFMVPKNLYIIGTMNTTDRSTGTLDYALRRRFAFVTLISEEDVITNHYVKIGKPDVGDTATKLFRDIKGFLGDSKHLCGDFDIDDLMIGHSYFMAKGKDELKLKMEYEIIPLINEYINDGILRVDVKEKKRVFNAWRNLETIFVQNEEDITDEVREDYNAE